MLVYENHRPCIDKPTQSSTYTHIPQENLGAHNMFSPGRLNHIRRQ